MKKLTSPEDRKSEIIAEIRRRSDSTVGTKQKRNKCIRCSEDKLSQPPDGDHGKVQCIDIAEVPLPGLQKILDCKIVPDNALHNQASLTTDYVFIAYIDLLFLTPYSPELNPIERVWKIVKKHATHTCISSY